MSDPMVLRLQQALNDSIPTLVEFYADWCPHCQAMMPVVAQLRERIADRAHIIQIEGEEHEALMHDFAVESFPTWILIKDGHEVWRDSGEMPLDELASQVGKAL